jgi:drug/metabolite transporter (DMT)-like permease
MENKKLSVILMILSALSFSFMGVMVKQLSNLPVVEAVFFRNLISLFIALFISIRKRIKIVRKGQNTKLLFLRGIIGLIGVLGYFYSIQNMSLADSAIINKMSPFFVLIFSYFILKENITKFQIISVILAFIGIGLVIKPEFNSDIIPAVIGLGAALMAGLAYTVVKILSRSEHPTIIVLYFSFVSVIGMLPFFIIHFVNPSLEEVIYLILTGVFAVGGQYGLTYAYKLAKASEVSIYSYATVIFSAIIAYFIWHETLGVLSIIGIGIVLIAGYLNYSYSKKSKYNK